MQLKSDKAQLTPTRYDITYAKCCWLRLISGQNRPKLGQREPEMPLYQPRRSEKALEQPDSALLPGHAVRDAGGVLEPLAVLEVPSEVPQERLLVRVLRGVA